METFRYCSGIPCTKAKSFLEEHGKKILIRFSPMIRGNACLIQEIVGKYLAIILPVCVYLDLRSSPQVNNTEKFSRTSSGKADRIGQPSQTKMQNLAVFEGQSGAMAIPAGIQLFFGIVDCDMGWGFPCPGFPSSPAHKRSKRGWSLDGSNIQTRQHAC
jgi:hypothetical protein